MRAYIVASILIGGVASAGQPDSTITVPRDTSYTLSSATSKMIRLFPGAVPVTEDLPAGVQAAWGFPYVSYGKRTLHLDLFRPPTDGKHPGVILIHGGGWRSGDRSMMVPLAERLAASGYVAAAVEYRLSPEARYPAAIHDLKAAVRWLRANAEVYAIDTGQIAALGCSAGGQLAALLGTTNGVERFEGTGYAGSSNVQAVVDIDGILDFTDPAESGKDTVAGTPSAGAAWFGAPYRKRPDLWIDASPLVHVDSKSAPIAFINSSQSRFHAGRDAMIGKLQALGIYYEVHAIPNTVHTFWLFDPWFEPTWLHAAGFLDTVFRKRVGGKWR